MTQEEKIPQLLTIRFREDKGIQLKEQFVVHGTEAERIQKHLDVSYSKQSLTLLHKPFLRVNTVDGHGYFFALDSILQARFQPKPVVG